MIRRSVLIGTGSALPKRAVSNAEMAQMVDTSDEWIVERTGIRNRYFAGPDETTSSLAIAAARNAIAAAGIDGASIDLIVLATATPDQTFPATATLVQDALGANGGIAFDVAAVCSGFLYALTVADSMLRTGMAQRALDVYRAMLPAEQAQVQAWLSSLGGERLLALDIPRLRLQGLRVRPEPAAS